MASEKDEPIVDIQQTYSRIEQYIIDNQKSLAIIIGSIIALVGFYFAWTKLYVEDQEVTANNEMFYAQQYFEQDSLDLAINGRADHKGFLAIADEYGITKAGNLAEYYLGMCYLKKGEYQNAIEHLSNFDGDDQVIAPLAIGAIGDAHMELGQTDEAISYYQQAADENKNNFTAPLFLKKAGLAYEEKGNYADAVKIYERIKIDFPETDQGKEIDKYIAHAKALIGA